MARHRHQHTRSLVDETEPDLTPLIDCVFLLLVFFMVTTVFLQTKGLDVDLPAPSDAEEEQKKDVNVVLSPTGEIEIGGEPVEAVRLGERLTTAMAAANNENIIVQAHEECAQRHVVFVVDTAKGVGVKGIAFVRVQEE
ncbi:MAG: biopolymer transporter ExbD [Gemmatimonadetes bacterium]|jgi:biopolymer transport protein ExbD|nr:biopolymer transporter ExbD [Gemmatimonadota bacterium]